MGDENENNQDDFELKERTEEEEGDDINSNVPSGDVEEEDEEGYNE